jgi:hypothetical protein
MFLLQVVGRIKVEVFVSCREVDGIFWRTQKLVKELAFETLTKKVTRMKH